MRHSLPYKFLLPVFAGTLAVLATCGRESPTGTTPVGIAGNHDLGANTSGYVYVCKDGPPGTYNFTATATSGTLNSPFSITVPTTPGTQLPCDILLLLNGASSDVTVTEALASGLVPTWQLYNDTSNCPTQTSCPIGDVVNGATFSNTFGATDQQLVVVRNVPGCTDQTASNYGMPGDCVYPPQVCTDPAATNFGGALPCVYNPPCPAGSFTFSYLANGDLYIIYDQFPAPNDNSYGVNAVGWPNGHKFSDLVGSDHAGFQLLDQGGTVRLSFNVDYLSANTSAPSGYASLGVTGGDGKMLVGTADGISATTSLAKNLNNVNIPGLFSASHVQQFGSVNVLQDSPPTDPAHTTYAISDPSLAGWDFHDTYFVTVSAAKLASIGFNPSTWQVLPNASQLHNSPAKACPSTGDALSITKYEVKDKQVKITILNSGSADVFLTGLSLTWPSGVNGNLMQVKLDGDVVYSGPAISGGTANLTLAQLASDQNKRKINHGSSDVYTLVFANNADADLSHYTGTVTFGSTTLTVLPH